MHILQVCDKLRPIIKTCRYTTTCSVTSVNWHIPRAAAVYSWETSRPTS